MCTSVAKLKTAVHPIYIMSDNYRKWHVVPKFAGVEVAKWKARGGWWYGASKYERRSSHQSFGVLTKGALAARPANISEDSD